jgi:hypothetical protein
MNSKKIQTKLNEIKRAMQDMNGEFNKGTEILKKKSN